MAPRHATRGGVLRVEVTMDEAGQEAWGTKSFPESVVLRICYANETPKDLKLTIIVGTKLKINREIRRYEGVGGRCIDNARSHTRLNNLLCDQLQPILISLVIAFVDREVETKASIDLNVNKAWTV